MIIGRLKIIDRREVDAPPLDIESSRRLRRKWGLLMNTELMAQVRQLIEEHPERHDQGSWVSNAFTDDIYGLLRGYQMERIPVEELRPYAGLPVPESPDNWDRPVCGTTACVAGWAAILAAPTGSFIDGGAIYLPVEGSKWCDRDSINNYAQQALGLRDDQATYLFSGYRTREQVLAALAYLPRHPNADYYKLANVCGG